MTTNRHTLSGVIRQILLENQLAQIAGSANGIDAVAEEIAASIRAEISSDAEVDAAFNRWAAVQQARGMEPSNPLYAREAFRAGAAMLATGDGAPLCHPVVAHALRLYGVDAEHIHRTALRTGTTFHYKPQGCGRPDVKTSGTRSGVAWPQMSFVETLAGDPSAEGCDLWTVILKESMPEILTNSLHGGMLAALVEVPGDPGMRIADIEIDGRRTIFHLLPPEID